MLNEQKIKNINERIKGNKSSVPNSLFKYRPFDEFTYDMLENEYLYLCPAKRLDDPSECKTPEWLHARKQHLNQHPFCAECLKAGKRTRATMVDHIVPIKQGGERFAPSNLQSLCWSCHSRKSAQEGSRWKPKQREYD